MSLMYSTLWRQLRWLSLARTSTALRASPPGLKSCNFYSVDACPRKDDLSSTELGPQVVTPFPSRPSPGLKESRRWAQPRVDPSAPALPDKGVEEKASTPEGEGPNPDQLRAVHDVLVESLSNLFTRPMNYRIYRPDLLFIDNIRGKRTTSLMQYVQQAALLRAVGHVKFAYVKFVILNTDISKEEGRITIRWRIVGISAMQVMLQFWKFKLWDWKGIMEKKGTWHDGVSYFDVGPDGLIYRHIADKMMVDKDKDVVVKAPKTALAAGLLAAALFPESSLCSISSDSS